ETQDVVTDVVRARSDVTILDAPAVLPEVPAVRALDPRFAQFWPHRHGTDAIFLSLLRRSASPSLALPVPLASGRPLVAAFPRRSSQAPRSSVQAATAPFGSQGIGALWLAPLGAVEGAGCLEAGVADVGLLPLGVAGAVAAAAV